MLQLAVTMISFLSTGLWIMFANFNCLWGDCVNGEGKYDYGYAVYTGTFKNGLPHGTGTMDYGGGNKFAGSFVNGKEDGTGLIFTNGVARPINYELGRVVQSKTVSTIGGNDDWKQYVSPCEWGDCANGRGKIVFPSGNVYEGNFRNFQFNGNGRMTFASGNKLEAEFLNHVPIRGTFYYAEEEVTFSGTFNEDGTPKTGKYQYKGNGAEVDIKDGVIARVHNPVLEARISAQASVEAKPCDSCSGRGGGMVTSTRSSYIGGIGRVGSSGFVTWDYAPQTISRSSSSFKVCTQCGGSGKRA